MIKAEIVRTMVHPVKGLVGVHVSDRGLRVDSCIGIVGDRNYALTRNPMEEVLWQKKQNFVVSMNTSECASTQVLENISEKELDYDYRLNREFVIKHLSESDTFDDVQLIDTMGRFNMCDNPKPYVSFINLATVRALSDYAGYYIDPERFRMSVWLDGLPAFWELESIKHFECPDLYQISIGDLQLGVDNLCERCRAIDASPETGKYDGMMRDLMKLMRFKGYKSVERGVPAIMGFLAIPCNDGMIQEGDEIVFNF